LEDYFIRLRLHLHDWQKFSFASIAFLRKYICLYISLLVVIEDHGKFLCRAAIDISRQAELPACIGAKAA
jgi:hypothetical protein